MTGEKVVKQKGWGGLPGRDEVFVEDIQDVLADVSQLFLHLDEDEDGIGHSHQKYPTTLSLGFLKPSLKHAMNPHL